MQKRKAKKIRDYVTMEERSEYAMLLSWKFDEWFMSQGMGKPQNSGKDPPNTLPLAQGNPFGTSDLQNYKVIYLCCLSC